MLQFRTGQFPVIQIESVAKFDILHILQGKSSLLVEECLLLINITQYGTIVQSVTMESRFLESSVFWKFPIIRTKLNFPLPVRHCNFTRFFKLPDNSNQVDFSKVVNSKNRDSTVPYISIAPTCMFSFSP